MPDFFNLGSHLYSSRLLLGSGKFSSPEQMQKAATVSGVQLVTVALRRVERIGMMDPWVSCLQNEMIELIPNTAGARDSKEAILAAELGRELLETDLVKLEIHPDQRYLLPDPIETLTAAKALVEKGFVVLPYVNADPVLCRRLQDVGCAAVMPLAAPIGSNAGLQTREMIRIIVSESQVPVIVDAGLGAPSQAAECMEMGVTAVLVNTAIATAQDPVGMASAFAKAVSAGRDAWHAGLTPSENCANATSPTEFTFAI